MMPRFRRLDAGVAQKFLCGFQSEMSGDRRSGGVSQLVRTPTFNSGLVASPMNRSSVRMSIVLFPRLSLRFRL